MFSRYARHKRLSRKGRETGFAHAACDVQSLDSIALRPDIIVALFC